MIVVDTDVIAYFWLHQASGRSEWAVRARRRDPDWIAPSLWRSEFRSVLRKYILADVLSLEDALTVAEKAEADMAGSTFDVSTQDVLTLVHQTGQTSYDCEYVALALATSVSLVTGDASLASACPDTAILLEDFVARET